MLFPLKDKYYNFATEFERTQAQKWIRWVSSWCSYSFAMANPKN